MNPSDLVEALESSKNETAVPTISTMEVTTVSGEESTEETEEEEEEGEEEGEDGGEDVDASTELDMPDMIDRDDSELEDDDSDTNSSEEQDFGSEPLEFVKPDPSELVEESRIFRFKWPWE